MPIYDFECNHCGKKFSKFVLTASMESKVRCKFCKSSDIHKLITGFSTISNDSNKFQDSSSHGDACSSTG
ncbi:zinc ribbon domain-containing protein [Candidatus Heimdallarchaeota archaeon]|nr:MAG: zinc ribbon domain-containing protein [Candidatus Heimdallarchaeota archaeon]